jgi:hypothetical protein
MMSILMFLVGFYLGILVFSLLAIARRKLNNKPLVRFTTPYFLHRANKTMSLFRAQLTHHGFEDTMEHDIRV